MDIVAGGGTQPRLGFYWTGIIWRRAETPGLAPRRQRRGHRATGGRSSGGSRGDETRSEARVRSSTRQAGRVTLPLRVSNVVVLWQYLVYLLPLSVRVCGTCHCRGSCVRSGCAEGEGEDRIQHLCPVEPEYDAHHGRRAEFRALPLRVSIL